jgi:hypothetical protein
MALPACAKMNAYALKRPTISLCPPPSPGIKRGSTSPLSSSRHEKYSSYQRRDVYTPLHTYSTNVFMTVGSENSSPLLGYSELKSIGQFTIDNACEQLTFN